MIALFIIFTSVIAIIVSWLYLLKDCKDCNVPGPLAYPIIGNGYLFIGPPTKFLIALKKLSDSYGNAVRIHLLHKRYIILYHPKYIDSILVSHSDTITKGRSYNFLKPWLGSGLIVAIGSRWKSHRKLLTPAFHFNALQNFLLVLLKNQKVLVEKLMKTSDGPAVDIFPLMALSALDNVMESIMGVSINSQKDSDTEYVKSLNSMLGLAAIRMRNPFLAEDAIFNLSTYSKIQEKGLKVLHGHAKNVINKRREELNSLSVNKSDAQTETGIENKYAFLDLLLLAEIDGRRISDEHVREEVDTFMFGGLDTTTSGMSFTLYLLSKHPDVQEKILNEQKSILGDDLDRDPTYSDLQQMKYLEQVIKESLRLFPPIPLIERLVTKDTDIAGFHIKSNTAIVIDIFHMHRNPELFKDPLKFQPERFDNQNIKTGFSWMPFSVGPRNCIGQKFAMMQMKITLAGLVKHFQLLPTDDEIQLTADVVLRSENGLKIKFKAR